MIYQLYQLLVLPLGALLFMYSVNIGIFSDVYSSTAAEQGKLTIDLLPDSSPRFFACNITGTTGTVSMPGRSIDESGEFVLLDGDPDTAIMGDARFDVHLGEPNTSLINGPGPELKVIELHGAEPINSTVSIASMGGDNISQYGFPQPTNKTNSCNYVINEMFVDLGSSGLDNGSSVPFVRFDNLGDEDSLLGADIADIFILEPKINDTGSLSSDGLRQPSL